MFLFSYLLVFKRIDKLIKVLLKLLSDDELEDVGEGEIGDLVEKPKHKKITKVKKKAHKALESDSSVKKDHLNIVFIGHVDAGKSTIGGQLLYLTGMVDKRTLEKYEREAKEKNRESWYLSWALDTNQEERDKGKTVEVGRAYFETQNKHFTLLDAPGIRHYSIAYSYHSYGLIIMCNTFCY